jgi:hypothetical protein
MFLHTVNTPSDTSYFETAEDVLFAVLERRLKSGGTYMNILKTMKVVDASMEDIIFIVESIKKYDRNIEKSSIELRYIDRDDSFIQTMRASRFLPNLRGYVQRVTSNGSNAEAREMRKFFRELLTVDLFLTDKGKELALKYMKHHVVHFAYDKLIIEHSSTAAIGTFEGVKA